MYIYDFKALVEAEQYEVVWNSAFIGDREEPGYSILLYQCGDFYAEVFFSVTQQSIEWLRTFVNPTLLEAYLDQIMGDAIDELLC